MYKLTVWSFWCLRSFWTCSMVCKGAMRLPVTGTAGSTL